MNHRRPRQPFNGLDALMLALITTLATVCILAALATVAGWRP